MRIVTIAIVLIGFGGVAGCTSSGSVSVDKSVSPAALEKQVAKQVTAKDDRLTPDEVTCPNKLKGKVGAKTSCTMLAHGLEYGVNITATKVKGLTVNFSLEIPPPAQVPPASLEMQVKKVLADQIDQGIASVDCPKALPGIKGKKTVCTMTLDDGSEYPATVTVTDADFFGVNIDVKA